MMLLLWILVILLLGRPWQFDEHVKLDDHTNVYLLVHNNKKIDFLP